MTCCETQPCAYMATIADQRQEIDRLRAALSWIEDQDPQIVDAARTKFNLEQSGDR